MPVWGNDNEQNAFPETNERPPEKYSQDRDAGISTTGRNALQPERNHESSRENIQELEVARRNRAKLCQDDCRPSGDGLDHQKRLVS
jgi:hypothetical protein